MAYEYEHTLRNYLIGHRNVRSNFDGFEILRSLDELQEVYKKAKAFDELKKHIDEEVDSYMALYRQTKDPIYSLLNSDYDTLLGFIEELERADDER